MSNSRSHLEEKDASSISKGENEKQESVVAHSKYCQITERGQENNRAWFILTDLRFIYFFSLKHAVCVTPEHTTRY